METRELLLNIVSSNESNGTEMSRLINKCVKHYLEHHNSFESWMDSLSQESFMSNYKNSSTYDMVVVSGIDILTRMDKYNNIGIEDYQEDPSISFESYTISNEGLISSTTGKMISKLAGVRPETWNKFTTYKEIKPYGLKALKIALSKRMYPLAKAIKSYMTRFMNYSNKKYNRAKRRTNLWANTGHFFRVIPPVRKTLAMVRKDNKSMFMRGKSRIDELKRLKKYDFLEDELNTTTASFPYLIKDILKTLVKDGKWTTKQANDYLVKKYGKEQAAKLSLGKSTLKDAPPFRLKVNYD